MATTSFGYLGGGIQGDEELMSGWNEQEKGGGGGGWC